MDQVEDLLDRPRLYHNIDGMGELSGSVMCLGFALFLWLEMHSPEDSVWHRISIFAFAGLMLLIHYGTKAIKTRITYPRTGFVEYRKPVHTQVIAAALGALTASGLAFSFRRHWDISALASLTGLVFAAACGYHFARAVPWKWFIVGAMAVASLAIGFRPADVLAALGSNPSEVHPDRARLDATIVLSLLAYGVMLLISGGISFWLYLRHTQPPVQDVQ